MDPQQSEQRRKEQADLQKLVQDAKEAAASAAVTMNLALERTNIVGQRVLLKGDNATEHEQNAVRYARGRTSLAQEGHGNAAQAAQEAAAAAQRWQQAPDGTSRRTEAGIVSNKAHEAKTGKVLVQKALSGLMVHPTVKQLLEADMPQKQELLLNEVLADTKTALGNSSEINEIYETVKQLLSEARQGPTDRQRLENCQKRLDTTLSNHLKTAKEIAAEVLKKMQEVKNAGPGNQLMSDPQKQELLEQARVSMKALKAKGQQPKSNAKRTGFRIAKDLVSEHLIPKILQNEPHGPNQSAQIWNSRMAAGRLNAIADTVAGQSKELEWSTAAAANDMRTRESQIAAQHVLMGMAQLQQVVDRAKLLVQQIEARYTSAQREETLPQHAAKAHFEADHAVYMARESPTTERQLHAQYKTQLAAQAAKAVQKTVQSQASPAPQPAPLAMLATPLISRLQPSTSQSTAVQQPSPPVQNASPERQQAAQSPQAWQARQQDPFAGFTTPLISRLQPSASPSTAVKQPSASQSTAAQQPPQAVKRSAQDQQPAQGSTGVKRPRNK